MERRYLAATLAMAATFAIATHAFNSGLLARLHQEPNTVISEMRCTAETLTARLLERVNRSFGPHSAEEPQLRVEMSLPGPVLALPPAPRSLTALPPAISHGASCPARRVRTEARLTNSFAVMQARLIAMQARLQSREMQRAFARAASEQARAARLQARLANLHYCRGVEAPGRSSVESLDFDTERLARQITEQVNRSLE